ncbi:MAG: hypothetical protein OQJ89_08905 [Kangiellaceae bacterium]|nr:hypothetical protein [Kangiellaceae bacterium]MCW9000223.1 hypothetical protein [Kangiellaceae bacterium]MCW9017069.1 hypothetical protein [Kangiellaceae bacterium]
MADIKGMTVSERLLIMDELDRFEEAIKNKDKQEAIEILTMIDPNKSDIVETVDKMMANPEEFGF